MPPPVVDYARPARSALSQVYLNDRLGDCVIAAIAHLVGLFTANSTGVPAVFTDAQILALYEAIGGYNPVDPHSDRGCDEQTALGYWQQHGAPAGLHPIVGWLAVDPTNVVEVKAAMYLFENLFFGIELPDKWVRDAHGDGFVWDAGQPNPNNGHAVCGVGFDSHGIQVASWGLVGTLTWAALQRDVIARSYGELYTVLSPEILVKATSKSPAGLAWDQLIADFDAIGGHVPMPPPPAPLIGPTRAQAIEAVTNALNSLPWTR